jgi:hypothetical protein
VACGPISKLPPLASEEVEAERRKQQVDHIRDYFAQRARLNNVAFRIRVANNLDCRNRSTQIGLDAGTVPSLSRKFRFVLSRGTKLDAGNRNIGCRDFTGHRRGYQTRRSSHDIQ